MAFKTRNEEMRSQNSSSSPSMGTRERVRDCCKCGDSLLLITSRSTCNPGRRFLRCKNYKQPWTCDFFDWYDGVIPEGTLKMMRQQEKEIEDKQKEIDEKEKDVEMKLKAMEYQQ